MCVVFCRGTDAASENPVGVANPKGAKAGCAFFWLLFFAQAKNK
jgi:hypothetical protein